MLKKDINFKPLLYLLPAFTMWVFIFSPYINYHLIHIDLAVYIQVAKKLLAGGVPYRDMWDHKPPMVYFLYALILKLFGAKNYVAINYVTLGFLFTSTILLYKIMRKIVSMKNAAFICFIYPILSDILLLRDAINPNTEIYMVMFNLWAVLVGLNSIMNNNKKRLFVAGLLVGVASAFKQPAGTMLVVLSIGFVIYEFKTKRWLDFFIGLANLYIGFLLVWMIIGGYFLLNSAWDDFIFQCFQFNFYYGDSISKTRIMKGVVEMYCNIFVLYPWHFIPFCFGIVWCLYNVVFKKYDYKKRFLIIFFLVWHLFDTVAVSMGGLFYAHYFVQWIPSCLIIMYIPLLDFFQDKQLSKKYSFRYRIVLFLYLFLIVGQMFVPREGISFFRGWNYYPKLHHAKALKKWEVVLGSNFKNYPITCQPKQYWKMVRVIGAIRQEVSQGETFLIWGLFPELYLLVDREPASKYMFNIAMNGSSFGLTSLYGKRDAPMWKHHDRIKSEFLADLEKNRPKIIILIDKDQAPQTEFFFEYLETFYEKRKLEFYTEMDFYYRK